MNFDEKLTILNIFSENNNKILVKHHNGDQMVIKNISKILGKNIRETFLSSLRYLEIGNLGSEISKSQFRRITSGHG
jgi:hypothetical protein